MNMHHVSILSTKILKVLKEFKRLWPKAALQNKAVQKRSCLKGLPILIYTNQEIKLSHRPLGGCPISPADIKPYQPKILLQLHHQFAMIHAFQQLFWD